MSKIRSISTLKKEAEKAATADELLVVIRRATSWTWNDQCTKEFFHYYTEQLSRRSELVKIEYRYKTFDEFENELDSCGITASAKQLEEILERAPLASTSSERELIAFARGRLSGLKNANLAHVSR